MNSAWVLGFGVLMIASGQLASLWKNPPAGRSPRQRRGGIFHRWRAVLWRFWGALTYRVFCGYVWLAEKFYLIGAPAWLVNLPSCCLPGFIRRAGVHEYIRRHPESFGDEGGQP